MMMKSYLKVPKTTSVSGDSLPWRVPQLCASYAWPAHLVGGGVIGIIELGGGWIWDDVGRFCGSLGLPVPHIGDFSVDGSMNSGNVTDPASGEVALDIQVALASYSVASGESATIRMYWAGNTLDAIAQGIAKAAADGCDTISISWGSDEANWGHAAARRLEAAAMSATLGGSIIFAAAGDNDSSDGGPTPANVDLPASAPHVIGCGGTKRNRMSSAANLETVWNNNPGNADGEGTGGGFSTFFRSSAWMAGAPVGPGRMVPDLAANADPNTGYHVVLGGKDVVFGGTSAVAPLYAGLFAAFGRKLGFVAPTLWKNHVAFNDIVTGNNGKFRAKIGPDACTGLGSPIGSKISALF